MSDLHISSGFSSILSSYGITQHSLTPAPLTVETQAPVVSTSEPHSPLGMPVQNAFSVDSGSTRSSSQVSVSSIPFPSEFPLVLSSIHLPEIHLEVLLPSSTAPRTHTMLVRSKIGHS